MFEKCCPSAPTFLLIRPKFLLQPNSLHQYYRRDVSIIVFPPALSHLERPPSMACHSYFINISELRSPTVRCCLLLILSPLSFSCSHSTTWFKGALTPTIKELLKLALTGHLFAAECQQRFSFCFDHLSCLFILLNSALVIDSAMRKNTSCINTHS